MNTVQRGEKIQHVLRMDGPINARDISDFIFQVDQMYEEITGTKPKSDDAYQVHTDEEGIEAVFWDNKNSRTAAFHNSQALDDIRREISTYDVTQTTAETAIERIKQVLDKRWPKP